MNRRSLYQTRRWRAVRRDVFNRDQWRCRHCGRPGKLECHHTDKHPRRFFDPAILLTLCRDCHLRITENEHPTAKLRKKQAAWIEFADAI